MNDFTKAECIPAWPIRWAEAFFKCSNELRKCLPVLCALILFVGGTASFAQGRYVPRPQQPRLPIPPTYTPNNEGDGDEGGTLDLAGLLTAVVIVAVVAIIVGVVVLLVKGLSAVSEACQMRRFRAKEQQRRQWLLPLIQQGIRRALVDRFPSFSPAKIDHLLEKVDGLTIPVYDMDFDVGRIKACKGPRDLYISLRYGKSSYIGSIHLEDENDHGL